jgi:hypothetical protein
MDGILINDLDVLTEIQNDQVFLVSLSGNSFILNGSTFYNTFSGVKEAENFGVGIPVYKEAIDLVDGRIGTSLKFHSISAYDGLYSILDESTIKIGLNANTIDSDKIKDNSITNQKISSQSITNDKLSSNCVSTESLQDYSVSTSKIQDNAITFEKLTPTIHDVQQNTSIQQISAYTGTFVDLLSVTVTPPNVNSLVLITGHLTLGLKYAGVTLMRTINDLTTPIMLSDTYPDVSSFTFVFPKNIDDDCPTTGSINFLDKPNTTEAVTYTVYVESTSAFDTYVNRAYNELSQYSSSRGTSQIAAMVLP